MNKNTPFLLGFILLSSVFFVFPSPYAGIFSILLVTLSALTFTKLDLMHPYTWYVPLFAIYAIADPILNIVYDFGHWESNEGTKEALISNWIALVVLCLTISPKRYYYNRDIFRKNLGLLNTRIVSFSILVISGILFSYYVYNVWNLGLVNKVEIRDNAELPMLYSFITLVFVGYCFYIANVMVTKENLPRTFLIIFIGWVTLCFLITGERDIVLRILWISLFLIHVLYRPIPRKILITTALFGIMCIPILQELKNVGVSGETRGFLSSNFLLDILRSEFHSAAKNLRVLIDNIDNSYYYGETLVWDIQRSFLGGDQSPTKWFGDTYYPNVTHGQGFSIVGEGYLNFGYFGVATCFFSLVY